MIKFEQRTHWASRTDTRALGPAALVAAWMLFGETLYGASLGDAVLYALYEIGFAVVPGCLIYRALTGRRQGLLRELSVGWVLGYALEIFAFMATAAVGVRVLFWLYPPVTILAALAWQRARSDVSKSMHAARLSPTLAWLVGGVAMLGMAYVGVAFFRQTPLPGGHTVSYFQDFPRALAIAADALHHWPIQDPSLAGEPFPYHYFVMVHMAAAAQVTGIALPIVTFRLFILPLCGLITLQCVCAGASLGRSAPAGLVAAAVLFFVGQLQMDVSQTTLSSGSFLGVFLPLMVQSPSFIFGLVFLVPMLMLIGECLRPDDPGSAGDWAVFTLLALGASDAKVDLLPLILGGLGVYGLWSVVRERRVVPAVWRAALIVTVIDAGLYLLQYRGHASGLAFDWRGIVDFVNSQPATLLMKPYLTHLLDGVPIRVVLATIVCMAIGLGGLLAAQMAGVPWALARARSPQVRWLICVTAVGLLGICFLQGEGSGNYLYLVFDGLVAAFLLTGIGLAAAWRARPARGHRMRAAPAVTLISAAAIALLILVSVHLVHPRGTYAGGETYLLLYGGLAVILGATFAAARRRGGIWTAGVSVSLLLLGVGAIGPFDDFVAPDLTTARTGVVAGAEVTPGLYQAMRWIATRTPSQALVAVNNPSLFGYFYSAFSERRFYVEGWAYAQRSRDLGYDRVLAGLANPFADRLALTRAAFAGNRRALTTLYVRFGVRYLLVDEVNGPAADLTALTRYGKAVEATPGTVVLELAPASRL